MVKRVGKYQLGKTLGEGTYGKVKLATNTEDGQMYAIKVLDKAKIKEHKMDAQVKQEISIMKLLKHEHVVNLIEVLASKNNIFLVLELITGGELFDKIVSAGRLSESEARKYFQELIAGVHQCHLMNVCHRDLKPENLLLDARGHVKISDFGLSSMISNPSGPADGGQTVLHTTCGTPNYVAPEVLANKGYDGRAADIWSCGVILFVLMAGYLPFDEPTWPALFQKIMRADFTYPKFFSEASQEFLSRILVADPAKRLTIEQLCAHPWFALGLKEGQIEPANSAPSKAEVDQAAKAFQMDSVNVERVAPPEGQASPSGGPDCLNAFELIAQGLDLSTMFLKKAEKDAMNISRITRFMTECAPQDALGSLHKACTALGIDCQINQSKYKAMLTQHSRLGVVTGAVSIYQMASNLMLVDFRRGKGDTLEYHKLYKRIHDHLAPIISKTDVPASV
mmetsp:Transcript_16155/g.38058  ORF Transcript_16155/g.38058 Transcript_16155/m.38058 type:complete len:452 (-) Transcript_16155:362-1717(-)|eukprot:CAMPEP_0114560374 /NCGR_PEP_ID=MMETSP0114-20121206/11427_1 /TAXON_ID=31324 /ORGANISM="Goniomonas sp, Strain m" /LENGTH=451 /DNA_ID=CAMNT_0001745919 /DNA_START=16 /DNA_END=1371 /DNA_ORIENTATION=+